MFDELEDESFPQREERVLQYWLDNGVFEKSVEQRSDKPLFTFYDGPPFATGLPHYGHHLAGTIKDVVPRYKTMKGFCVPRRFGWDCHGLPVESEIEKKYNLSGAASINNFGIAKFNEECRGIVQRYTQEWRSAVLRMGRWVDFNNVYRTMDPKFMESVWWVFKQIYEKGLVYEGFKVMPYSAKLGTPLSNFEAGENYKDVDDPALTVAFELLDDSNTFILAWTTTPWTLVSNVALLVSPEIEYVRILDAKSGRNYILGRNRLSTYYPDGSGYTEVSSMKGEELIGKRYKPLFDYFADRAEAGAFRVISEASVSTEEGTGIVHGAPAFGEVDFYACKAAGIDLVCPVDGNGLFTNEVPEYVGQFVKDADKDIAKRLKANGNLFHQATIHHRYPFCPRSDTPLIYKAVRTWFVAVEKIKDHMVELNQHIHWTPEFIKHKRFGNWLAGARDWAISRNRYWGTPIPLWRAEDGEILVIGSVTELEELTGAKIPDLHRHFIDDLVVKKDGKTFTRIPEVFDCWFESGSMPYAQNHYPFENQELFQKTFPADFIAEGLDQTRGWFYTLIILSTILFDEPPFRNVIVNGIILAEDGAKMSKRLKNYPDPALVVAKYGADAIRLYMLHSPAVKADDLSFSERGVELILRQILIPWWNAYSFFITYAKLYNWKPDASIVLEKEIDLWMISLLNKLVHDVERGMDDYDLSSAVEPFVGFVDQLTNWYIRRSRRRFWDDQASPDRDQAFATLYRVLVVLSQIAAPFVPFVSEAIFRNLRQDDMPESVHLTDFPVYRPEERDLALEAAMAAVQKSVSLGHALRKEHRIKVRQPLANAHIASGDPQVLMALQGHSQLIADELNVKEVLFSGDEEQFVSLRAKPNFRILGKKVGALMPAARDAIAVLSRRDLSRLAEGHVVPLTLGDTTIDLTSEDVEVERVVHEGRVAANEDAITIALNTTLNEDLILEGLAREIVNKVNTMRREAGFAVSDRITLELDTTPAVVKAFEIHGDFIKGEVLAIDVIFGKCQGVEWDLNGEATVIAMQKATA
ncbi:MAG: isoleucine--tRNA ligase [Chlamydiales bacterium]|nr:isoleucine--tRNA ligase [Chlamydiales bacterium]